MSHAVLLGAFLVGGYIGLLVGLFIAVALVVWLTPGPLIADEPNEEPEPDEGIDVLRPTHDPFTRPLHRIDTRA